MSGTDEQILVREVIERNIKHFFGRQCDKAHYFRAYKLLKKHKDNPWVNSYVKRYRNDVEIFTRAWRKTKDVSWMGLSVFAYKIQRGRAAEKARDRAIAEAEKRKGYVTISFKISSEQYLECKRIVNARPGRERRAMQIVAYRLFLSHMANRAHTRHLKAILKTIEIAQREGKTANVQRRLAKFGITIEELLRI